MSRLIQHVTNFLNRVKYTEINYPEDIITLNDSYEGLKQLRDKIYSSILPKKSVQDNRPVVLIVYNTSTKVTIDLYLSMKPSFQLIVQSPMMLYSEDRDDIITIYNNDIMSNSFMLHHITPLYHKVYSEVILVIKKMGVKKVIVLGNREGERDGITYISDLSDATDDVELVIDTMLNEKNEYVNFAESVDRACSFENVIYYRLMDSLSFDDISMGNRVDKEKIIMEALDYDESFSKYFSETELSEYRKKIKGLVITKDEKYRMLNNSLDIHSSLLFARSGNNYLHAFLAVLFSNYEYLRDMIEYPPPTDDLIFNGTNRYRVLRLLKEEYGSGLMFYVALLLKTFSKLETLVPDISNTSENLYYIYNLLTANNINARIFVNIIDEVRLDVKEVFKNSTVSTRTKELVVELLKIYGHREMKLIDNHYYEGNKKYTIDTYYTSQEYVIKPNIINPLVVDEDKAIVYLWL